MGNKKYAVLHTQIQINESGILNSSICVCIVSGAKELFKVEMLLQEMDLVKHPCKM